MANNNLDQGAPFYTKVLRGFLKTVRKFPIKLRFKF